MNSSGSSFEDEVKATWLDVRIRLRAPWEKQQRDQPDAEKTCEPPKRLLTTRMMPRER